MQTAQANGAIYRGVAAQRTIGQIADTFDESATGPCVGSKPGCGRMAPKTRTRKAATGTKAAPKAAEKPREAGVSPARDEPEADRAEVLAQAVDASAHRGEFAC